MTDVHPGCEEDDPVDTSSPVRDDNVYATPAATPPPALEGEDGSRTPPGTSFPPDDPQLRVSPKRKVENMDQGLDSSAELPMSQRRPALAQNAVVLMKESINGTPSLHPSSLINVLLVVFPGEG